MTQSTRTIAQIEAAIAVCEKGIDDIELFIGGLQAELEAHEDSDQHVIGYPQYGWYLNANGSLGGVLWAKRYSAHAAARMPVVTNGKGEVAIIASYVYALTMAISQQQDCVTAMWGVYRDLEEELCEAQDAAADAAYWDAQADEAAYYDGVSLHWADRRDPDDCYEQRRDEKAERDADARQDR